MTSFEKKVRFGGYNAREWRDIRTNINKRILKEQIIMSYSFNEELDKASSTYKTGSSRFYKVAEGNQNVIRILTEGATIATQYMGGEFRTLYGREKGDPLRQPDDSDSKKPGRLIVPIDKEGKSRKPSIRLVCYILDREDGRIKIAELPYSVSKQVGALQSNPDYAFTSLPMPYDIRITYKKDVAPNDMYRVEFKPNSEQLSKEVLDELNELMLSETPQMIVDKKKQYQSDEDEKKGMRLSIEELETTAAEYNEGMRATMAKQQVEGSIKEVKVKYPDEEINPADIPF